MIDIVELKGYSHRQGAKFVGSWNGKAASKQRENGYLGACPSKFFKFVNSGTLENAPFQTNWN